MIEFPVPADELPRIRAILAGELEPVEPRLAVSVVLLRDGADGPETLLLRRSVRLAFAPGRWVFPGGAVEPSDADPAPWAGVAPEDTHLVVAGVRETFEESGVLLAVGDGAASEEERAALEDGTVSLATVLRDRGFALDAGMFAPFAHWVTPVIERKRFDTRFLLAAMPDDQEARAIPGESDRMEWVRPADALARELPMMPPTLAILRELSGEPTVADALARPRDIPRIQPGIRLVDDRIQLLLP